MLWDDLEYNKYELFLIDLWGTIHNGRELYDGAIEQLNFLKQNNKKIVFLTNASRTKEKLKPFLKQMGLNDELYDDVVSSGEVFKYDLQSNKSLQQNNVFNIGDLDVSIYSCKTTNNIQNAQTITIAGTIFPIKNEYFDYLSYARYNNMTILCLNPDICCNSGNIFHPTPGYLAKFYEEIGGKVIYYGKPYSRIYEHSLKISNFDDKNKIIAIGDNLKTDIQGANNFGIASYRVKTGLAKF